MKPSLLLIGAGDLGTEIGLRYCASPDGGGVVAVRRRAELVPAPIVGISADIADGLPHDMPTFDGAGDGPRHLIICLTAGGRDESIYRATFLDGVKRVLDDVREREWTPGRALFVSSTGVCASEGVVTEETPPAPSSATSAVLLDAERAFLAGLPHATRGIVIRPSGLYGPGREWFIDQVRRGAVPDPARITHRVHRDDVARAAVHLLTMAADPDELYLVTDDAPVEASQVAEFIAAHLDLPAGAGIESDAPSHSSTHRPASDTRRLSNARLHATGFDFLYPSYRDGYAAVLDDVGVRHP